VFVCVAPISTGSTGWAIRPSFYFHTNTSTLKISYIGTMVLIMYLNMYAVKALCCVVNEFTANLMKPWDVLE